MEYKLSVIIPVYNAKKTLMRAFRSLKRQTIGFNSIEVLLCDDCSNDGSYEIEKKLSDKYSNVKLLKTKEKCGPGGPRNLGIESASADYIMFLDSDDEYTQNACEALYREVAKDDYDFVTGKYNEISANGKINHYDMLSSVEPRAYIMPDELATLKSNVGPFCCKLYKKSVIIDNNIRFLSNQMGEDTLFSLKFVTCAKQIRYINDVVYYWHNHADSFFHTKNSYHFLNVIKCYTTAREILESAGQVVFFNDFLASGITYYMDELVNSSWIELSDMRTIIEAWWGLLRTAAERNLKVEGVAAEIVLDDAKKNDIDAAVFHMSCLLRVHKRRKAELDEVFNSRGWKIISGVNRLLGRGN